jgi:hypothetical protein
MLKKIAWNSIIKIWIKKSITISINIASGFLKIVDSSYVKCMLNYYYIFFLFCFQANKKYRDFTLLCVKCVLFSLILRYLFLYLVRKESHSIQNNVCNSISWFLFLDYIFDNIICIIYLLNIQIVYNISTLV